MCFILVASKKIYTNEESVEHNKKQLRKLQILRVTVSEIEKI